MSRNALRLLPFLAAPLLLGCPSVAPPKSTFPSVDDALSRMHETVACGNGIHATAKLDQFAKEGRVRGEVLLFAHRPAKLRLDAVAFGVNVLSLGSDGQNFQVADLRNKVFYQGPAKACNLRQATGVPIPGHALVGFLRGEAPVLVHQKGSGTIQWNKRGFYELVIPSTRDAQQTLHLGIHPDDFGKPWNEQRTRVLDVVVTQKGGVLYHAELEGYSAGKMAEARIDPENIEPPIPPSGPMCTAELPKTLHVEVPGKNEDVVFKYEEVEWNPPIPEGAFSVERPAGMPRQFLDCDGE